MAAEIRGSLYDKATKEQLVGAYVTIKSIGKNFVTELDGSFHFKDLAPGSYLINITYLGYDNIDTNVVVTAEGQVVKLSFYMASSANELNEVKIQASAYGGSDEFATKAEQQSISLVNILSANAIQISPDITVANVLQRISGIVMDKGNSGESRYAVIRGMEKKYNTTLVNGVKVPSPNDRDRYVPLDIFPAELLERLEVNKTLMPSMEGDATGGSVNMVMKNAPSKFTLEASVGAGYSDIFQNRDFQKFDVSGAKLKSPAELDGANTGATPAEFPYKNLVTTPLHSPANATSSLTIGNRYLKNKLGVIVAGSFQDIASGPNSDVLVRNATIPPSKGPNDPNMQPFSDILVRRYSQRDVRGGVESKVDYAFNDKNSLDLSVVYAQLNEYRVRNTTDSQLGGYSLHGFVGPVAVSNELQTRQVRQSIYNVTLQGHHKILDNLNGDWSLVASEATQKMPDIATFSISADAIPNVPAQTLALGPATVGNESRQWEHNTDKDLSVYANLHYFTDVVPTVKRIDVGGLYRHRDRDNYYNKYKLNSLPDSGSSQELYRSIPASQFFFSTNEQYGNGYQNAGTYTFSENISAYYVQLHDEVGEKVKIDGGVRIENTDQSYVSSLPAIFEGKSASFVYTDVLPSAQVKYEFNSKSALRLDYFRSIYRPAFADLIPFLDPNANETYPVLGSDSLRHSVIDNFDLRYELFPKGLDQLLVGVFYKYLTDPIEYVLLQGSFAADLTLHPENAKLQDGSSHAQNAGLELVYRRFFGNFGVAFNYTYTNSDIATGQRRYYASAATGTQYITLYPHRPLQGQAANIGNLSFLYKDQKRRIEGQLAFVYSGERIYGVGAYAGLDTWEKATLNLDFSAQKKLGKRFTVYFKANNLLNTPFELIIKQPNSTYSGNNRLPFQESASYVTVQRDIYYRTFLLGLRYKI